MYGLTMGMAKANGTFRANNNREWHSVHLSRNRSTGTPSDVNSGYLNKCKNSPTRFSKVFVHISTLWKSKAFKNMESVVHQVFENMFHILKKLYVQKILLAFQTCFPKHLFLETRNDFWEYLIPIIYNRIIHKLIDY